MEGMADIRIVRERQVFWDKNTDYYVVVDDQVVGTLQANQSPGLGSRLFFVKIVAR
jgi:ABC-type xylose transport system substrate-binding protein